MDLDGKSQEEVVALLRAAPMDRTVNLVAIRQEDPLLPREVVSVRPSLAHHLPIQQMQSELVMFRAVSPLTYPGATTAELMCFHSIPFKHTSVFAGSVLI